MIRYPSGEIEPTIDHNKTNASACRSLTATTTTTTTTTTTLLLKIRKRQRRRTTTSTATASANANSKHSNASVTWTKRSTRGRLNKKNCNKSSSTSNGKSQEDLSSLASNSTSKVLPSQTTATNLSPITIMSLISTSSTSASSPSSNSKSNFKSNCSCPRSLFVLISFLAMVDLSVGFWTSSLSSTSSSSSSSSPTATFSFSNIYYFHRQQHHCNGWQSSSPSSSLPPSTAHSSTTRKKTRIALVTRDDMDTIPTTRTTTRTILEREATTTTTTTTNIQKKSSSSTNLFLIPSQVIQHHDDGHDNGGNRQHRQHRRYRWQYSSFPSSPPSKTTSQLPSTMDSSDDNFSNEKGHRRNGREHKKFHQQNSDDDNDNFVTDDNYIDTVTARTDTLASSRTVNNNDNSNNNRYQTSTRNGTRNGQRRNNNGRNNNGRKRRIHGTNGIRTQGNLPDIYWKAIPMEHLRLHPNFVPLPEPETISRLTSLEDFRTFRQDSWQWDILHCGRYTTSQAVAALGFIEPMAGKVLGIPASWKLGSHRAYEKLILNTPRTLEEVNTALFPKNYDENDDDENDNDDGYNGMEKQQQLQQPSREEMQANVWLPRKNILPRIKTGVGKGTSTKSELTETRKRMADGQLLFAANYLIVTKKEELLQRKIILQKERAMSPEQFDLSVRYRWGEIQEPTALLTALNYFWNENPNIKIVEVGMCGAGIDVDALLTSNNESDNDNTNDNNNNDDTEKTKKSSYFTNDTSECPILVGATPDALLQYPNGTVEVIEVKNHCPFYCHFDYPYDDYDYETNDVCENDYGNEHRPQRQKRFSLMNYELRDPGILSLYVPQLMMEMLCVGPDCRSAIMVRQSATAGARIFRIYRDDEWINEMLYWLCKFQRSYVDMKRPPPKDFFYSDDEECQRYQKFLQWTKQIEQSAVLLDHVKVLQIQRAYGETSAAKQFFLD